MTENPVGMERAITEELTNTEESRELEHLDSRQSDDTNISEKTARLDISDCQASKKKDGLVEAENDETINAKEPSQLIEVNDEIMENYDFVESSRSNGEVEMENQEKEKEKEKAIKVRFVLLECIEV